MQHMTTTDGITIHHGDYRLGQSANLHLHIQHAQAGHTLIIDIATTTLHMHIATTAERVLHFAQRLSLGHLTHRTRQQHHADALQLPALCERLTQLQRCLWRKRITIARTVYRNLRNAVILFEENLLEFPNLFPFSFCHISFR